jgi:hypothetical protein
LIGRCILDFSHFTEFPMLASLHILFLLQYIIRANHFDQPPVVVWATLCSLTHSVSHQIQLHELFVLLLLLARRPCSCCVPSSQRSATGTSFGREQIAAPSRITRKLFRDFLSPPRPSTRERVTDNFLSCTLQVSTTNPPAPGPIYLH